MLRRVAFVAIALGAGANEVSAEHAHALRPSEVPPVVYRSASRLGWATSLSEIVVHNKGSNARSSIRLYSDAGEIEPRALDALNGAAESSEHPLAPRVAQLLVKAVAHFGAHEMTVISGYRSGHAGKHSSSEAVDFEIQGVRSNALASYLRTLPKVGVGIYTNPKTRYVHLDVREESFHWFDASPPGRTWREKSITDRHARERDAAYSPKDDLPDH